MTDLSWEFLSYSELTLDKLYALLALRAEVFIEEQACAYQDLDYKDQLATHLLGWQQQQLVAYLRLTQHNGTTMRIGRVVLKKHVRGQGIGQYAMQHAMDYLQQQYPGWVIILGAQCISQAFYEKLGFQTVGQPYDEDGILHVYMTKSVKTNGN